MDVETTKNCADYRKINLTAVEWVEGRRETDTGWLCFAFLAGISYDISTRTMIMKHGILKVYWMPVDYYNGADHAIDSLLYSRFWIRIFYKLGLVPTQNLSNE